MKKIILFISVFTMSFLNAQNVTDALQYSQQNIKGTARFRALSGAFGALGGDLSAIQINPAGSAIFLNSYGSLTLASTAINNDANYFNGLSNASSTNLNFNQAGSVFVYNNYDPESSGINKITLGLLYDQVADNADDLFISGRSNNSIDRYFLSEAQGVPLDLITVRTGESVDDLYSFLGENEGFGTQQAFLGYEAFVIEANDRDNPNNTSYFSNIAPGVFDQEYIQESTGLNGKFTLNLGAQVNQDYYIGVNLNSHFINYDRTTLFTERNSNTGSTITRVDFDNRLSTTGSGFSAQIGGIAKVSDRIRLGASYESPTWYYIEEETTQRLITDDNIGNTSFVDPDVINIFPEYRLRTPENFTGSIAFLFNQEGLISIDYSYKDYSSIEFDADGDTFFSTLNSEIDNLLDAASTLRIGTEWRNGNWSVRGGYSFEESPYKNKAIMDDKTGFSIGAGYNFGKFKFDVAYDYTQQQRAQQFYPGSGFSNGAIIDSNRENLTFTLGMNFD